MAITIDEMRKLLEAATPGEWRADKGDPGDGPEDVVMSGDKFIASCHDGMRQRPDDNAALIALAPYLARRVIVAEKLVDALRQAELTTEELCRGQSHENQCWVILGEIRAALAEYEATTNAQ